MVDRAPGINNGVAAHLGAGLDHSAGHDDGALAEAGCRIDNRGWVHDRDPLAGREAHSNLAADSVGTNGDDGWRALRHRSHWTNSEPHAIGLLRLLAVIVHPFKFPFGRLDSMGDDTTVSTRTEDRNPLRHTVYETRSSGSGLCIVYGVYRVRFLLPKSFRRCCCFCFHHMND